MRVDSVMKKIIEDYLEEGNLEDFQRSVSIRAYEIRYLMKLRN